MSKQNDNHIPSNLIEYNDNQYQNIIPNINDTVEFNSDPDDDDFPHLHIQQGTIKSININQIKIELIHNGATSNYFIDDIKINKILKNKKLLNLSDIIKINCIQRPYWWNRQTNNIVVECNSNTHIYNEIALKFYQCFNNSIDPVPDKLQIYCVQNINLWKKFQNHLNTNKMYQNESYLWYGTNNYIKVNNIYKNGFNVNNTPFYIKLNDHLRDANINNVYYIFMCRVLYDNHLNTAGIVKVFNNNQVYPEFLIQFKLKRRHYPQNNQNNHININNNHSNPNVLKPSYSSSNCLPSNLPQSQSSPVPNYKPPPPPSNSNHMSTQPVIIKNVSSNKNQPSSINQKHSKSNIADLPAFRQEIPNNLSANMNNNQFVLNPSPPVHSPATSQWTCIVCTCLNNSNENLCIACRAPMPMQCPQCTALISIKSFKCKVCGIKLARRIYDNNQAPNIIDRDKEFESLEQKNQLNDDQILAQKLQKQYELEQNIDRLASIFNNILKINHDNDVKPNDMTNDEMLAKNLQKKYDKQYNQQQMFQNDNDDQKEFKLDAKPKLNANGFNIKPLPPVRYNKRVHGTKDDIMTLYHVTDPKSAELIKKTQKMKRGTSGMFGGGIYFAETPKDANYKAEHKGMLVECKVYVGKAWKVYNKNGGYFCFRVLWDAGFDSVWAPYGSGSGKSERVVYNWDQVQILSIKKFNK